jgi:hypothetical protein
VIEMLSEHSEQLRRITVYPDADITGRTQHYKGFFKDIPSQVCQLVSSCNLLVTIDTGRTGLFPSYEAFIGIVATMVICFSKY